MPRRIVCAKMSEYRQCAILPLLSETAAEWAEKVGPDRLRARKVSVIFISAAESLPRQGFGKLDERFRALLQYRKELCIPETTRPIMSYTDAFPNLYGKDRCHFSAAVAARAFLEMVTDAVKHVRTISGDPQPIVVVVCAGWNAEPTKGHSRLEAFVAKQLSRSWHSLARTF